MKIKTAAKFFLKFLLVASQASISYAQTAPKNENTKSEKAETQKNETPKPPVDRLKGADINFISSLDYPELQVVPRASERLAMESPLEKDLGLAMFWPFQLSGLATMATGLLMNGKVKEDASEQEKKDASFASTAATGIGVAWIGLTYYLLAQEPYGNELNKIRKYKGTDKKTDLLRERIAEEALQKPAELIRTLTWISVVSNLGASLNLMGRSTPDNNLYPAIGAMAAFLPMIFRSRYVDNYEKHLEYKRKIYAPIVSTSISQSTRGSEYVPQLLMTWNF